MKACLLGNACMTLVGDRCKEVGCDHARETIEDVAGLGRFPSIDDDSDPLEMLTPPKLDSSRGQAWWDSYFMGLAMYVATASRDPSTQCGAVIVRPDKTVASMGFNGFPRGVSDAPELYADRASKYRRVVHAEMNALLFLREPATGYTMYVQPFLPCDACAVHVVQSGIRRLVAPPLATHPDRWKEQMAAAVALFAEASIEVKEHVGFH